jgi:hypothetical protein
MAVMQQPAKGLGEGASRVNGSHYVAQDHFTFGHPFLQGKFLDVDVMDAIRRTLDIGHHYGSRIIIVDFSGFQLSDGDLKKDGTEELSNLCSANGFDKLTLSGAEADRCYQFRQVSDGCTSKAQDMRPNRPMCMEVAGVCGIKVSTQQVNGSRRGHLPVYLIQWVKVWKWHMW